MSTATANQDAGEEPDDSSSGLKLPPLRILCLHGAKSNAADLSGQLEVLGERLYEKYNIDLVYINSPLILQSEFEDSAPSPSQENPKRVWWEEEDVPPAAEASQAQDTASPEELDPKENGDDTTQSSEHNPTSSQQGRRFFGLDASLLLIRQVWASMPFWGLLCVGDGAAVASFLPFLENIKPQPAFGVFVDGSTILPDMERLVSEEDFSSLHIWTSDAPSAESERLFQQFGGQVHQTEGKGNKLFSKSTLNAIGKFLVAKKKNLRMSFDETHNENQDHNENTSSGQTSYQKQNVLALQNQLYHLEQQAAHAVAQHIAKDPPKALMAVIAPQQEVLGGWSGPKRRAPNEEGGGAPCPSDFLLQRNQRTTTTGPSREHPGVSSGKSPPTDDILEEDPSEK